MNYKHYFVVIFFITLLLPLHADDKQSRQAPLKPKYAQFLNDVNPLISNEEKDYFKKLNDSEKEQFITSFWNNLDPVPITPENEFKEAYYQRLEYVDTWYGRNSDRGRIYLMLGKPDSTESFLSQSGIYPVELWEYDKLAIDGLPNSMRLLFFKPYGVQDYRLYSPLFDGLQGLLIDKSLDTNSFSVKFAVLAALSMGLRTAIESISPGMNANTSELYVARLTMPFDTLKEQFSRKERAIVETQIVYNALTADMVAFSQVGASGNSMIHLGVMLPGSFLTYEKVNDTYYSRTDVSIQITDNKNRQIDQITDQINLSFSDQQWKEVNTLPVFYSISYVLLPGTYHITMLLRNFTTKQIGKIEKNLIIPDFINEEITATGLLLGYKATQLKEIADNQIPFVFSGIKFFPVTNARYTSLQKMHVYMELYFNGNEKPGVAEINYLISNGKKEIKLYESRTIKDFLIGSTLPIYKSIPLNELTPGNYSILATVSFGKEQKTAIARKTEFVITSEDITFKRVMAESSEKMTPFLTHVNLARQYLIQEKWQKAEEHLTIALDFNRDSFETRLLLTDSLLGAGKNDEALKILLPLNEQFKNTIYILTNLGRAYFQKADYKTALDYCLSAEKAGAKGNYFLLNYIGESYMKLGKKEEALNYFEASVRLNESQPGIVEMIRALKDHS
jgi:GWxTD domain-containing protein